ncbi:MAG: hypothetical protein AAFV71_17810 [Cyanobacteria bacterium J06633_8]
MYKKDPNLIQDLGAAAADDTVEGEITNRDNSVTNTINTVSNTINGTAAGAAIHILKGK